jgi:hypothetical protein
MTTWEKHLSPNWKTQLKPCLVVFFSFFGLFSRLADLIGVGIKRDHQFTPDL